MLTARVEPSLLAAFDVIAEGRGGRSALLRAVLSQVVRQGSAAPAIPAREGRASHRITLSFTDAELTAIDGRAAEREVDRSGWIKALVRRHLGLKTGIDDRLRDEVAPIRMQLQRIGRNLNQAMRAGNAAMMADSGLQIERELRRIADMREEISSQVAELGEVLRGDSRFWEVAD